MKSTSEERAEEIRKIKEAEAEALSVALCVTPHFPFLCPKYSVLPVALAHPKRKARRVRPVQARTLYPSLRAQWQMRTSIRMQLSRPPRKQSGSGGEQNAGRRRRRGEPKGWHAKSNTTHAAADVTTTPSHHVHVHGR